VTALIVRYPSGAVRKLGDIAADRVVTVAEPARPVASAATVDGVVPGCAPAAGVSAARYWDAAAARVLRTGEAPDPVQARDLYDLSLAIRQAYLAERTLAARNEAIAFAAYRLLVWQASLNRNLAASFAELSRDLGRACFRAGGAGGRAGSAARAGERIAAAAIAAGRRDGSNEELRFADPAYTPQNAPLVVAQAGSTAHDATFWQPLALAQVSPRGSTPVPAAVQTFVGSQWGSVRTFAGRVAVAAPALGDPGGKAYAAAALAAIRATAGSGSPAVDASPAAWNDALPSRGLAADVRLDLTLDAALNDAAVSAYGAKRRYQSPRPIEIVRYLAFNDELPLVPGLVRKVGATVQVRERGRWVRGDRWTPPAATPPSPGYPSAGAAYAAAARAILGPAVAAKAARAERAGVAGGTELPQDAAAGRKLGAQVAARVLARLG
jgi:hypothetical protein